VQLGMRAGSLPTALDLEEGLAFLDAQVGPARPPATQGPGRR
jgi:hypothetical protein